MTPPPAVREPDIRQREGLRLPPLQNGDFLTSREFIRRYEAMRELKKAELLENIVYMNLPVDFSSHARPDVFFLFLLSFYEMRHQDCEAFGNATWVVNAENTAQPDAGLRKKEGSSWLGEDGYLRGAPELVAEISSSTVSLDNHARKRVYQRAGVREYIVWRVRDQEIDFWRYDDAGQEYVAAPLNEQGVWRSTVFPGLAFEVAAVLRLDHAAAIAHLA